VVIADDDGVVIVPKLQAAAVAAASAAREAKEAGTRKRLAAGELGLDVYGMRESLARAGLKYFDDEAAWQQDAKQQQEPKP
jgi:4-hydroxy-4-methyl-2-oxoglutarate aldolase